MASIFLRDPFWGLNHEISYYDEQTLGKMEAIAVPDLYKTDPQSHKI